MANVSTRHAPVDLDLKEGLAVVPVPAPGDSGGPLLGRVRQPVEQETALARRELAPRLRLEAGARRPYGVVDLGFARLGHLGERLLGGGVRETVALRRRPPLVPDQQVRLHRPLNSATRLSTYAAIPSFASSHWNNCCCSSRSSVSADP